MNKSRRKRLNQAIKLLITVLLIYALYGHLIKQTDVNHFIRNSFLNNSELPFLFLFFAVALMPFNWLMESLKWQKLMQPLAPVSIVQSYRAILAGITISIFTPNRIGEYAGRILELDPKYNWKGVIATLVGSIGQLIIYLSFGAIATTIWLHQNMQVDYRLMLTSVGIMISLVGSMSILYFHTAWFIPIVKKLPLGKYTRPIYRQLLSLKNYSTLLLSQALVFSFTRYLIFCTQYYLLMLFFNINIPLIPAYIGIAALFFIQTGLPLPAFISVIIRGQIALTIWESYSNNELAILSATYLLFIINLSVPALLGLGVIVKTNVLKSLGYEN